MSAPVPLVRLFQQMDERLERVERTWWGVVATDSRFPLIYDTNYAAVDTAQPHLTLAEVQEALLPALEAAKASHEQVWIQEPEATARLMRELEEGGGQVRWDTVMEIRGSAPEDWPRHRVEEVGELDDAFWDRQREALPEFDVSDPAVVEQFLRWQREVLVPFGKRWFTVRDGGAMAGFGSVTVRDEVGYVDDVVTFPPFRRRGVAGAIMIELVEQARAEGARDVYLLADEPGPMRLYERLGWRHAGRMASSLRAL